MKDVASKKSESASEAAINLDVPLPACKQHQNEDKSSTSSYAQINHIKVKGPLPKEVQLNATKPEQRQTAQIQVFMKETLLVRDSLMQP
jgi:hypothetical protein